MTDHELLELAAKAAGIKIAVVVCEGGTSPRYFLAAGQLDFYGPIEYSPATEWNPLANDGDAFRLAVNSGVFKRGFLCAPVVGEFKDPYDATRRAIVRAAAEIGKTK